MAHPNTAHGATLLAVAEVHLTYLPSNIREHHRPNQHDRQIVCDGRRCECANEMQQHVQHAPPFPSSGQISGNDKPPEKHDPWLHHMGHKHPPQLGVVNHPISRRQSNRGGTQRTRYGACFKNEGLASTDKRHDKVVSTTPQDRIETAVQANTPHYKYQPDSSKKQGWHLNRSCYTVVVDETPRPN